MQHVYLVCSNARIPMSIMLVHVEDSVCGEPMLTVPGLFVLIVGILMIRSAGKPEAACTCA